MGRLAASFCFFLSFLLLISGCDVAQRQYRPVLAASPAVRAAAPPVAAVSTEDVRPGAAPASEALPAGQALLVQPPPPKAPARPARSGPATARSAPHPSPQARRAPSAVPSPPSYPQAGVALSQPPAAPPSQSRTVVQPRLGLASYPQADPYGAALKKAEGASLALDGWIQSGGLQAGFLGTSHPTEMVYVQLWNRGPRPMTVELTPGMILNPGAGDRVQPLLVTESAKFVLKPGEHWNGPLLSYCLDSRVPAPAYGQPVDYRFALRTRDGGAEAVRAYLAAQRLVGSSPYAHAMTQIAIWKSLGQPVGEEHLFSLLGPLANDRRVRAEVLREVDRVLRSR